MVTKHWLEACLYYNYLAIQLPWVPPVMRLIVSLTNSNNEVLISSASEYDCILVTGFFMR